MPKVVASNAVGACSSRNCQPLARNQFHVILSPWPRMSVLRQLCYSPGYSNGKNPCGAVALVVVARMKHPNWQRLAGIQCHTCTRGSITSSKSKRTLSGARQATPAARASQWSVGVPRLQIEVDVAVLVRPKGRMATAPCGVLPSTAARERGLVTRDSSLPFGGELRCGSFR